MPRSRPIKSITPGENGLETGEIEEGKLGMHLTQSKLYVRTRALRGIGGETFLSEDGPESESEGEGDTSVDSDEYRERGLCHHLP